MKFPITWYPLLIIGTRQNDMIYLMIYMVALAAFALTFRLKGWYKLNHAPLDRQPLFWAALTLPVISFLYFGAFSWQGYQVVMTSEGLDKFVNISKLPLGLLSLSIPLLAIVANAHRATQIDAQIQGSIRKNAADTYYAHQKNFTELIRFMDLGEVGIFDKHSGPKKIAVAFPHQLYRAIYTRASIETASDYAPDGWVESVVRGKIASINDLLSRHVDDVNAGGSILDVSDEIDLLCPLLQMTYEIFDCLGIANISRNHFYIRGLEGALQLNIGSEPDLKILMQLLLKMSTSVIDIVSTIPLKDTAGLRRYAYTSHRYVFALDQATELSEWTVPTWRDAVYPTKATSPTYE